MPSFGDKVVEGVRQWLAGNNRTSLGQMNANILREIVDRVYDYEQAMEKAQKSKVRETNKDRKPLFSALANACGINPEEMPASQARACAVALEEILKVMPAITEEEFWARADRYRQLYRDAPITPSALKNHWGECGGIGGKALRPRIEHKGPLNGLREPEGWLAWAKGNIPEWIRFTETAEPKWQALRLDEQQMICKQMGDRSHAQV